MSNIIINVEFLAGTSVAQAVTEARSLAIQNDLAFVKFKFNGYSIQHLSKSRCQ